jgi:hypothetical protein
MGRREQRSSTRQSAEGHGTYTFTVGSDVHAGECRVLDVSESGAGLELYGPGPRAGFDKEIFVRLEGPGYGAAGCTLHAWVRNVAHTKFGFVRVGIEFVMFSAEQHTFVRSLIESSTGVGTRGRRNASTKRRLRQPT